MFGRIKQYIKRVKEGRLKTFLEEMRWIYSYGKNHVVLIVIYTVIGLSETLISLSSSVASKDLVDIVTGHNTGEVLKTFITIIALQLLSLAVSQLTSYISTMLITRVSNGIKADIYEKIMNSDWESISKYHSGELSTRWSGDSTTVSSGLLTIVPNMIQLVFRFISALILVVQYDASFAIISLISAPITIITTRRGIKKLRETSMNSLKLGTKMTSFTSEAFVNFQYVKAFNLSRLYARKVREVQDEQLKNTSRYHLVSAKNTIVMSLLSSVVTYATYGWGIYKVWNGGITYGTMTMFLTLSASLTTALQAVLNVFPTTINVSNSARRLMQIAELPKEDMSHQEEAEEFGRRHGDDGIGIDIEHVSYHYASGTEVFDDVSLKVNPGEVVALVGPSGEGKTTMLRIILSLVRGQQGETYIFSNKTDGSSKAGIGGAADMSGTADIEGTADMNGTAELPDAVPAEAERMYQPTDSDFMELSASTRVLFAYVPQGNTMFSGTIADNMRYVKEDATDEEIVAALKQACAWEFVKKLPEGINTPVQERGGGLSEGQSQRLSIARALLRKSPILLLDEATSALDVVTEKQLLKNISTDQYVRTTIVTTHRLSVLNSCDYVYRIHNKKCELMTPEEIQELINT